MFRLESPSPTITYWDNVNEKKNSKIDCQNICPWTSLVLGVLVLDSLSGP